jgi:hypothetical protein
MGAEVSTSIEERFARAAGRWANAVARQHRARLQVENSRWLLTSSRAVIERPRPLSRGGGAAGVDDAATVRERLRAFIASGVLPPRIPPGRLWVGPSRHVHACAVCGVTIRKGETEAEFIARDVTLFLDRSCLRLWSQAEDGEEPGQRQDGGPGSDQGRSRS